jgi:DNA-binding NtrC family response regulator
MSYCQLSKFYYEGLLNKTGGRVKDAARMAGLHENTFRSRLDKLGIPFLRKDISVQ